MSTKPLGLVTVLSTPELFEAILLKMDLRDLLFAQQICRAWKDTIATSPALQRKLFFAPTRDKDQDPFFNPLLQEVFPSFLDIAQPWWELLMGTWNIKMEKWYEDVTHRDAFMREEASWRRMLPVQPAAQIQTISQASNCCGYMGTSIYKLSEESQLQQTNGAPMGLIYDIMIHILDEDSASSTSIEWHMFLSGVDQRTRDEHSTDLVRLYEIEEERRLAFRPGNKITIRGDSSFCYNGDEKLSGLRIQEVKGGLNLEDFTD